MTNNVTTKENSTVREPSRETRERQRWLPPVVNIVETKDGYLLEAEMPGVGKAGLEILLEGNELTIIGRRTSQNEEAELIYRESQDRDYRRTFELDPSIDAQKISAQMDDGVLHMQLPKAEKVKPRKITVE